MEGQREQVECECEANWKNHKPAPSGTCFDNSGQAFILDKDTGEAYLLAGPEKTATAQGICEGDHLEVPYQALKICEMREVVRIDLRYRRYTVKNFEKFYRGWSMQVQKVRSLQCHRYVNETLRVFETHYD